MESKPRHCKRGQGEKGPIGLGGSPGRQNLQFAGKKRILSFHVDVKDQFRRSRGADRDDSRIKKLVLGMSPGGRDRRSPVVHRATRRQPIRRGGAFRRPGDGHVRIQNRLPIFWILHKDTHIHRSRPERRRRGKDGQVQAIDDLTGQDHSTVCEAGGHRDAKSCHDVQCLHPQRENIVTDLKAWPLLRIRCSIDSHG